jgi:hypothetical protein
VGISLPAVHPDFGQAAVIWEPRPTLEDEAFTAQTIERMSQYAAAAARSPMIRQAALMAASGHTSQASQAGGIWKWIRDRVRFRTDEETARPIAADPENTEVLIPPEHLLRMAQPSGDCDDFSMLAASMLLALGIPASFRTVAADPATDRYSHVYVIAHTAEGTLPLDCSHGRFPGWEVRALGKARDWRIEEQMGLGAIDWNSIVKTSVEATSSILKNRYGQPNVNPGTYVDASRGVMYRQPAGASDLAFPGIAVNAGSGGTSSLLLLGVAAVVIVLLVKK